MQVNDQAQQTWRNVKKKLADPAAEYIYPSIGKHGKEPEFKAPKTLTRGKMNKQHLVNCKPTQGSKGGGPIA